MIESVNDYIYIEMNKFQLKMERIAFREEIEKVYSFFDSQIKAKGLEFKIRIDQNVPQTLLTDGRVFRQLMLHLISNAVKFTFKGFIEVRVSIAQQLLPKHGAGNPVSKPRADSIV